MANDQNPVEGADVATVNATAEKDVQNVLAELRAEEAGKKEGRKDLESNGKSVPTDGETEADAEAKEEARIIAAAAKLGQESVLKTDLKETSRGRGQNSRGFRGGKRSKVGYRDNIRSDFSTLEETSDPGEIRKQVEFYFSDSNLPMDKFLLSKVGGSENRPVELSVLHSFKRMRRFQPLSAIVAALKESKTLELTNDDTCVRRKIPLPETVTEAPDEKIVKIFEDQAMHRSIYAKGFGFEEPRTQFDIEAFFTPFGPTNAIRLRRTPDKIFKGSVFVEFDSEETQKAFLALDPKPKWKGTTELLIKSKKDYCDEKLREIEAGRLKPNERFPRSRGTHRGRGRSDGTSHDDRDWRERRADDQKKGFQKGKGGHRGERGRGSNHSGVQKDARGVPVVQVSKSETKSPEPATSTQQEGSSYVNDSPIKAGQKRTREAENGNASGGSAGSEDRPAKKVDAKDG